MNLKNIILSIVLVLIVIVAGLLIWTASYPDAMAGDTPAGYPRTQSQYLTMRDGVKIAIEVILPADLAPGQQVPALLDATRYSHKETVNQLNLVNKLMLRLGLLPADLAPYAQFQPEHNWAGQAGYAVVLVNARGSAASFGSRPIEWSPAEVADYGEIIAWIAQQPWSTGNVGAWGSSYPGNTAELMVSTGQTAFKAAAPRFSDFDPLLGVGMPGGLRAEGFLDLWSDYNAQIDSDPALSEAVSTADGEALLLEAIAGHNNPNIAQSLRAMDYRDDEYAQSGLTFAAVSPYALRNAIEADNVPMQVWVSWLDAATVDGALSRYLTFSNPQEVIIGAWNHGGGPNIDPFVSPAEKPEGLAAQVAMVESLQPQMAQVLEFFDCHLKETTCQTESKITYYTLNSGEWQTTTVWPPEGFTPQRWYFAENGALSTDAPADNAAVDEYAVDFSGTTGQNNRWFAQFGHPVDYTIDRAAEDAKLLTYTTPPFSTDIEITGSPIITLYVASTSKDGAFHVYLEDVAPNGKVTYITEGVLRAIHRAVSTDEPPYTHLGPYHTFNRADAALLTPGQVAEISFNLYATSVLIEAGHSLRVAIAGADADTFAHYPAEGSPMWRVHRDRNFSSNIEIPAKIR